MYLSACGLDNHNQLGIAPTTKILGISYVDAVTRVPFDLEGVQCVSAGSCHSVIIKLGRVFAAGDDGCFRIGSDSRQEYETFTEIKISEEPISWAACGYNFTLYLTVSGKVILCHKEAKGERIHVEVGTKAVSVFAGCLYGGIIDEEGAIHILDRDDPHKPPRRFSFESPAVDLACCNSFVCALTSDGRVFANGKLNNGKEDFAEVSSLKGKKIEKLSGYYDTCAALTSDGRVFICGRNTYGQLGNGTRTSDYSSFTEVRIEEAIKDVSCSDHTLFLTESNKILGCGNNDFYQLFKKTEERSVFSPINSTRLEADQVITGDGHSFILSGTGKLENPSKAHFRFLKQEIKKNQPRPDKNKETPTTSISKPNETHTTTIQNLNNVDMSLLIQKIEEQSRTINRQDEKIESLVSMNQEQHKKIDQLMQICKSQSQSINQLHEVCRNLGQKNEANERKMNEMDRKLDVMVKYINDLDVF